MISKSIGKSSIQIYSNFLKLHLCNGGRNHVSNFLMLLIVLFINVILQLRRSRVGLVIKCIEIWFNKSNISTYFGKMIRVKLHFFGCFLPIFNCFNLDRVWPACFCIYSRYVQDELIGKPCIMPVMIFKKFEIIWESISKVRTWVLEYS